MVLRDAQFCDFVDAAPDAAVVVDAAGQIVFANSHITPVFGYEPHELVGERVETLVAERCRAEHRRSFSARGKSRPIDIGLELAGLRKDGSEFPAEICFNPVRTEQGTWVYSAYRDVSRRQQAVAELADTVQRLQSQQEFSDNLIATLQGIILLLDTEGRITLCNPYFERLTGYTATEVQGRDWFETFIPEDERKPIETLFRTVMQAGLNEGYTNAIVTKRGERRLIEWHSKTLEDANGRIIGLLCTGLDCTERSASAAALQAAKEAAERATTIKSRFLAAASHDLRQPLQSLALYLSVLTGGHDRAEHRDVSDKMRLSLDTMRELLNALLDISKLDGGSIVPEKRNVRAKEILDRIVTDNLQQAEQKGLQFECTSDDCVVHSDPALLERVIENFVTNAIRYTEHGRVGIDCRSGDGVARITVTDTGVGIPEDKLDKVFEEYYQLDNPVRDRREGLGLGLSIVKHIARLLDHPLDVSSVPGEGSAFSVTVPLGSAEFVAVELPAPFNVSPRDDREPVVLLVDDDPAIVDAMTMLLESAGMHVHCALNGDDALAQTEAGVRPDIVVSDYRLPGYTGTEVIRRIRQATVSDLPTILMTGDTSAHEIEAANISNCTVLHKPVDTDRLLSLIADLTARGQTPAT